METKKTAAKTTTAKKTAAKTASKESAPLRTGLVLTNCTDTPRGITLSAGVLTLAPREIRSLTDKEGEEVRALFRTRTFQRFVDNEIFRLTGMEEDEESTDVPTPDAPLALTEGVKVEGLQNTVDASTPPKVVEFQQGGPLPDTGTESAPEVK